MALFIQEIERSIYEFRREWLTDHVYEPSMRITFSRDGIRKARADEAATRVFESVSDPSQKCFGLSFTIDHEQDCEYKITTD